MTSPKPVLGTRGSALALWQAHHVRDRLAELGVAVELRIIRTEGDATTQPFDAGSERGAFVTALQSALERREIDFAVHSLKDVPTAPTPGLVLAAVLERHDPRDVLLSRPGDKEPAGSAVAGDDPLSILASGATVGTGSPRRRFQMLARRPDLRVVAVRGNVDTRIRRLHEGAYDALVLALAGVERLGITGVSMRPLGLDRCLPAAGQGAVTIETREDDTETRATVGALDHPPTRSAVEAERAALAHLRGGCLAPVGLHATVAGDVLTLAGVVGGAQPDAAVRARVEGHGDRPDELGRALASRLLADGAADLLAAARSGDG